MNKEQILQMTSKEIENFLNGNISTIINSVEQSEVKGQMIADVEKLFDNSLKTNAPYYTKREFVIIVDKLDIIFKVGAKNTGKTKRVSRLKKKDIKTTGKFKFDDIRISFNNPYFEADDLDNYKVKLSKGTCSGGAKISLKHRKEPLIDMLSKNILFEEIQKQDGSWKDIRREVILNAAQPKIKKEYFIPDFNQEKWDIILQKTEEYNKELIDDEIEKIFKILE